MGKKTAKVGKNEEQPKKRILFFTMTSGAGHNVVTANVKQKFDTLGFETKTIDLFAHDKKIAKLLSGFGFKVMFKFPKIANFFWNRAKRKGTSIYDKFVRKVKNHIIAQVNEFGPDVIISSHVAGQILTYKYGLEVNEPFRDYFIITDYDIPPTLKPVRSKRSFIVVPTDDFKRELEDAGYISETILPFGIPISDKFYEKLNRTEVLAKLNLPGFDKDLPTVLMMGGGKGLGKIACVVKRLAGNPEIQIITVCGKNEKLKKKIEKLATRNAKSKKPRARIYNHGFCTNIEELMTVSHFSVGKTGGISSTEAIAKGLQVVSFKKLPFPELANLRYLESKGLAKSVSNVTQLEYLVALKPEAREKCDLIVEDSAEKIVSHVLQGFSSTKQVKH